MLGLCAARVIYPLSITDCQICHAVERLHASYRLRLRRESSKTMYYFVVYSPAMISQMRSARLNGVIK